MKTARLRCDCDHKDQDKLYGKGLRLHNYCGLNGTTTWRCSVCNEEK